MQLGRDDDAVPDLDLQRRCGRTASSRSATGCNLSATSSTTVAVTTVAPVLDPLVATAGPIAPGQPVTVSGAFTDAGTNDTHTSLIDWGDMTTSVGLVTEVPGSGLASAGHTYALPGTYTVSADVSDKDGGIVIPRSPSW